MRAKTLIIILLLILSSRIFAQETADTAYIFRFVPGKDMFYIPYKGNEVQLHRLQSALRAHHPQLITGQMFLCVSSYAASSGAHATPQRMAYLRNSRVKSELIQHADVTERMFVTGRLIASPYGADSLRNVVVVTFPAGVEKVERIAGPQAAEKVRSYNDSIRYADTSYHINTNHADTICHAERSEASTPLQTQGEEILRSAQNDRYPASNDRCTALSLRFNLLRWVTLTADLGLEYRPAFLPVSACC
ncbi:MAG: hypothetical protein LUE99_13575 [Bacteroides sp.]|nr:hypothetical protein [Bacteroides sp.]